MILNQRKNKQRRTNERTKKPSSNVTMQRLEWLFYYEHIGAMDYVTNYKIDKATIPDKWF